MNIKFIQNLLTPIFNHIHLPTLICCFATIFIASLICFFQLEKHRLYQAKLLRVREHCLKDKSHIEDHRTEICTINRKIKPCKHLQIWRFLLYFMICLSGIYLFAASYLFYTAYQHGYREYWKQDVEKIIYSVHHSPIEDILPDDTTNITVIYYRFGCDDCNKLYNQLSEKLEHVPDIYWIATRSKQGIYLRETFPVETVPSAIYITDTTTAVSFDLYIKSKDINGNTSVSLNTETLNELLQFRNNHKKE